MNSNHCCIYKYMCLILDSPSLKSRDTCFKGIRDFFQGKGELCFIVMYSCCIHFVLCCIVYM